MEMKRWANAQLKTVDAIEYLAEIGEYVPDDHGRELAEIVTEAQRRATAAGLPLAVTACQQSTRIGQIGKTREALAACIGAAETEAEYIDIAAVGELLGIHPRTVRRRSYDGTLPPPVKMGRATRWRRLDIENYRGKYRG